MYGRDIKTIGKHINNALREELKGFAVVAKFATTATDGKTYQVEHYNLDMILSVGYRVKSQRGILFRRWANEVLKNYLLKGHLLNYRFEKIERKLFEHDQRLKLDLQRHNKQYAPIQIHTFSRAHDRFLIIDEETVYHIGASMKDLGKKLFAFSRINLDATEILKRLDAK